MRWLIKTLTKEQQDKVSHVDCKAKQMMMMMKETNNQSILPYENEVLQDESHSTDVDSTSICNGWVYKSQFDEI